VALPLGCTTVDGAKSYDVGRCQELPCQHPAANRSSTCRDTQAFCCGATATARVEMVCEDGGAPVLFEVRGRGRKVMDGETNEGVMVHGAVTERFNGKIFKNFAPSRFEVH
jgi:hypothetical protein